MPLRKVIEESGVSLEAAQAMHSAFNTVVQSLEQAGLSVSPGVVASHIARMAAQFEYDAAKIAEAVLNAIQPR